MEPPETQGPSHMGPTHMGSISHRDRLINTTFCLTNHTFNKFFEISSQFFFIKTAFAKFHIYRRPIHFVKVGHTYIYIESKFLMCNILGGTL